MRVNKVQLYNIIKEEIAESIRTSRMHMQAAQEIARSLKQLEQVMVHLLHQKQNSEPGTEEYDKAKENLSRLAAVAQEYAHIGER
jgi:chaperonin cofactor prefoldin